MHLKRKNKQFDETTFEGKLAKMIHQMKRKPKGNILRTSIFKVDYSVMVEPHDWVLLNETEEENASLIDDLRGIIPTNMLRDFERFVYYSSNLRKYIMVHRSIVDPQLGIFHKNFSKNDPFDQTDANDATEIDKKILAQQDLDLSNFSLDHNSLLERHRLLV